MTTRPRIEGPPPRVGIRWRTVSVMGRRCRYGVGGDGPALVFLHGWALGRRAYSPLLERLGRLGRRVLAPSLPGFGGTAPLRGTRLSFDSYADWLAAFLDAVGAAEPVVLVGHSFGGGVAIKLAHDRPERVSQVVLVSSVGAPTREVTPNAVRKISDRSLWEWGYRLPADLVPSALRSVPHMAGDLLENVLRDPRSVWSAANLIRNADMTPELRAVGRRGPRVVAMSGRSDRVINRVSFDELCSQLGTTGVLVDGGHSWVITHPDDFAERLAEVIDQPADAVGGDRAAKRESRGTESAGGRARKRAG